MMIKSTGQSIYNQRHLVTTSHGFCLFSHMWWTLKNYDDSKKNFEISLPGAEIQHFLFLATRWIFKGEYNHFFISHVKFLAVTLFLEGFLQWKQLFNIFWPKGFIFEVKILIRWGFHHKIWVWKFSSNIFYTSSLRHYFGTLVKSCHKIFFAIQ